MPLSRELLRYIRSSGLHSQDSYETETGASKEERTYPSPLARKKVNVEYSLRDFSFRVIAASGHQTKVDTQRGSITGLCDQAARADSTVLLTGESGSGKDFWAKYIHDNSIRGGKPFISVNCSAIPHEMAETELFGHVRGAFTHATGLQIGLIEMAEGGTLLLNEIGEMPLSLQPKLLTFLDTKKIKPVGRHVFHTVNVRIIAATNRELERGVAEGRFRQDLFYRLNKRRIIVPPLRDRTEEIPQLAKDLLSKIAKGQNLKSVPDFETKAIIKLQQNNWPGNVRELESAIECALEDSHGSQMIGEEHLVLGTPRGDASKEKVGGVRIRGEDQPPKRESWVRSKNTVTDEDLKHMYEVVCGGRKGAVAAIARVLGKDRAYISKELKRIRGKEAALGRPSKREADEMERDVKEYLSKRHQA